MLTGGNIFVATRTPVISPGTLSRKSRPAAAVESDTAQEPIGPPETNLPRTQGFRGSGVQISGRASRGPLGRLGHDRGGDFGQFGVGTLTYRLQRP